MGTEMPKNPRITRPATSTTASSSTVLIATDLAMRFRVASSAPSVSPSRMIAVPSGFTTGSSAAKASGMARAKLRMSSIIVVLR